ncbi:MAG: hypothetical protein ACO1TE_24535 [Prosthecobacter sp.]
MTTLRLLTVALSASFVLTACDALKHYDSRYPTVSQQDAYDVSWGLAPRKSRGNPKLRYQYDARSEATTPVSAPPPAAPEAAAPAPAPISPLPAEQTRPAIPASIR